MNDHEAIEMMARSSAEIKSLRAQITALEPKAHAYDSICTILGLLPRSSQGYGEDVAWLLDRRIGEIKKAMVETPAAVADAPAAEG